MLLRVEGLTKKYSNVSALKNVGFSVSEGELLGIIGPSGAGKTTLLKILAGIEDPDEGSYSVRGGGRGILVFQNYVLFPFLTVFENIAFGLRSRRLPKDEIQKRVDDMLSFFGLTDKRDEYPRQLSSGQQQRVALARAMILRPPLLLLDEPFANLDKNLKMTTAEFIRETQRFFNITTIVVTHDQTEAFAIADRVGVILEGELRQTGTFENIYNHPGSLEVAAFLGTVNVLTENIKPFVRFDREASAEMEKEGRRLEAVRAENISIEEDETGDAVITGVYPMGALTRYTAELGGAGIKIDSYSSRFSRGDRVRLTIKKVMCL